MRSAGVAALALALGACATVVPVAPPAIAVAPEQRTLAAEIAARPELSAFAAALRVSGGTALRDGAEPAAPVTVFATNDDAYARLAPGVADSLLAADNRGMLDRLVAYHLVAGAIDDAELRRRVAAGGGSATLATLAGEPLTLSVNGETLTLTDGDGDRAYLGMEIVRPGGVIHVVNGFLAPDIDR